MIIYLTRHGIAFPREDPACPPDEERPLTERGRQRTEAAARGLAALDVDPTVVLTSSLVRAVQTAEIIAEVLGVGRALELTDSLDPGANPTELFATLRSLGEERVLCAGHSPNLDRVIAEAIGSSFGSVFLKKCGTACVEFLGGLPRDWRARGDKHHAELLWVVQPRILRRLARAGG